VNALLPQEVESTYPVILTDPPWFYYGDQKGKYAMASKHYNTESDEDLIEIGRPPLSDPGILFMWTTSAKMGTALRLIEEWGLHYRGVAFTWIKVSKVTGKPFGARGPRASITKPLCEYVLAASTKAKGRPLKFGPGGEGVVSTVFAPVGEHSAKPTEVHERIEILYPEYRKLEMFARNTRRGWDVVGDEVPGQGGEELNHSSPPTGFTP
jgi:N6-adenosine-specific RNA methylase IME4